MRDEWDDPEDGLNAPDPIAVKAWQLKHIEDQIDELTRQARGLTAEISVAFPPGIGEHVKTFGDAIVTLIRSERWHWNKGEIKKILLSSAEATDPLSEEVRNAIISNVSFHRSAFARLSKAAQDLLRAALTIKDGPVSIEVERKEDEPA